MLLNILTPFHVALSLIGLLAGFVSLLGMSRGRTLPSWTGIFLAATVATSLTGFLFPRDRFLPAHAIGILSLAGLAVAIIALYFRCLRGGWRKIYIVSAVITLYLNMFVAIVQSFLKIPFLKAAAPTQAEAPFILSQIAIMALFVWIGWRSWTRFGSEALRDHQSAFGGEGVRPVPR